MYRPPILGFDEWRPSVYVQWADGAPIGILGGAFDPKVEAERARKEQLRSHDNVVLLSDYLEKSNGKN